jgi:valyl-tRNA synthetase
MVFFGTLPFAASESDLKNYYPGTTLITARDILNLWVARMIYSGIEFKKELPFTNVFINGTILTKDGKRMSKSLGTGIDPLKYIDQYGADATRFGIIWQANGQDIRWDETAITAGKKFANKLWNASRLY